jgi:hypothetical protein
LIIRELLSCYHFGEPIGAAAMIGMRHKDLNRLMTNRIGNAWVIGGNNHTLCT